MVVWSRPRADVEPGLSKALLFDAGISIGQQFTNLRSVLGPKRGRIVDVSDVHVLASIPSLSRRATEHRRTRVLRRCPPVGLRQQA